MLWFEYEVSSNKCMYWRLVPKIIDWIIEEWLDHEFSDLIMAKSIGRFIVCWHCWEVVRGGTCCMEEGSLWMHDFERYLVPATVSASWLLWGEQLCSTVLPMPWCLLHLTLKAMESAKSWTEPSETMSQNKSFLPFDFFLGYLSNRWKTENYTRFTNVLAGQGGLSQ
jgi:hypothetical protein